MAIWKQLFQNTTIRFKEKLFIEAALQELHQNQRETNLDSIAAAPAA